MKKFTKKTNKKTHEHDPNVHHLPTHPPPNYNNEAFRTQFSQSSLGESYGNPILNSQFSQSSQFNSSFPQPQYTPNFSPPQPQPQYHINYDTNNPPFHFEQHSNPQFENDPSNNSNFFRHNYSPNYPNHSFASPNVPPPSHEPEHEPNKNVFYHKTDDCILARAWVRITDDPITANEQHFKNYWARIVECFNTMANEEGRCERGLSSLKNRLNRMKQEMTRYVEAMDFIDRDHHTGWNPTMRAEAINKNFAQRNNGKEFKFEHCVEILLTCSKYNFRTSTQQEFPSQNYEEPLTPTGANSSQGGSTRGSGYSGSKRGSDELTSPEKRPIGNKAAKRMEKTNKGKGRKLENDFEKANLQELQKNYIEGKMALQQMRMKALEEQMAVAKEETRAAAILAKEERIMRIDPSTLFGEEKEALLRKRAEILEKWLNN